MSSEEPFKCSLCKKTNVSCLSAHIDYIPICDECRRKKLKRK